MPEKFDNDSHANNDILLYKEDFDEVTFLANQMPIFAADIDRINLDNNTFCDDHPFIIIHVRLLAWCRKFKKRKALKKKINEH